MASSEPERRALEAVVAPDDELLIVVPAVEQSRLQWLANDEDEARERAAELGASVEAQAPADTRTVEVKPDAPRQVLEDAVAEHRPDRIVVAVREGEDATWLERGELERLPETIDGVPVTRLSL